MIRDELDALIDQARDRAKQSRYALVRVSQRRYGIVVLSSPTVTQDGSNFIGWTHGEFAEDGRSLTYDNALELLIGLRRAEEGIDS